MDNVSKVIELIVEGDKALLRALTAELAASLLVVRDWRGNGGKLGYAALAAKHGVSLKQARATCQKWKRAQEGQG